MLTVLSGCTSLARFRKISPGYSWNCPRCSSLQFFPSPSQTVSPSLSSKKSTPKNPSTINNSSNLPNHPQLTSTYSPSAPPQPQPSISSLTQSTFHHSRLSHNCLRVLQSNANGIRSRTELNQFLSLHQCNLTFVQESHLSSGSTFHALAIKSSKKRSVTKRETTNCTGNLEGVGPYACQKRSNLIHSLYLTPFLAFLLLRLFGSDSKNKRGLSYSLF